MKKFRIFLLGIFCMIALISFKIESSQNYASASTEEITITINSMRNISENTTFNDEKFLLYTTDNYCFYITNNSTVTFNNCDFVSDIENQIRLTCLFYVESGSTLILNNATFEDMYVTKGINNCGIVELNNAMFNGSFTSCVIENNSNKDNSIIFRSGKVGKIILNSGYISVDKDTNITGTTKVSLPNHNSIDGKLVVKGMGNNVFANKHIGSFSLLNPTDGYYLDYVGDDISANIEIDSYTTDSISSGDIIISTQSMYLKNGDLFTGNYCTANTFLSSNIKNETNELYKYNSQALNNYIGHTTSSKYAKDTTYNGEIINLTINTYQDEELLNTSTYKYVSGSNHAVFLNIPNNYELKSENIQYLINGTENSDTLKVSENLYSNGTYIRPIVQYIASDYIDATATINIKFTEIPKEANISITKSDNISVTQSSNIVGTECTFSITPADNINIVSATFNNQTVALTNNDRIYTFTATLEESNTLVIDSYVVADITITKANNINVTQTSDIVGADCTFNITSEDNIRILSTTFNNTEITLNENNGIYSFTTSLEESNTLVISSCIVANTTINKSEHITVNQTTDVVGTNCTFTIAPNGIKILSVTFNDMPITLTNNNGTYTFEAMLEKSNTIIITSPIQVVVTPDTYEFTFGDTIEMTKIITVEETQEQIEVQFIASNTNAGTHEITIVQCSNEKYEVSLATGKHTYTINKKTVSTTEIILQPYTITYSEDLNITADKFISSKPAYFDVICNPNNPAPVAGSQTIQLLVSVNNSNYKLDESESNVINATLIINPAQLNTDDYYFEKNYSVYYDTHAHMPSIYIDEEKVNVSYVIKLVNDDNMTTINSAINAGTYFIEATLSSKSANYTTNKVLSTTFQILPVTLNIASFKQSIEEVEFTYSKSQYYITPDTSLLPCQVEIDKIENNLGFINADTYNIDIYLSYDKTNYICEDIINCKLVINPLEIDVFLEQSSFVYNGSSPTLSAKTNDLYKDDQVNITLSTNIPANVGNYAVDILSLNNTNYMPSSSSLDFEITPASINTNNLSFENINVTYDGLYHNPILVGTLPTGITHSFNSTTGFKDAGTYSITCSFSSTTDNYIVPSPIETTLTINKKPIRVVFTPPANPLANNDTKECLVSFEDTVYNEIPQHEISYSGDTSVPGTHTCFVHLPDNSNYTFANANFYDFIVFASKVSHKDNDINLTLTGEFNPAIELTITKTTNTQEIINLMSTQDHESYTSYNIEFSDFTTKSVTVSVVAETVTTNVKYLKIYKVEDGKLINIKYTTSKNNIVFELSQDEQLIFVQENTSVQKNIFPIILVSIISTISLITIAIFVTIHKRKTRKTTN